MSEVEQRANIKFCQKLGKSATETLIMIQQVYGEEAMGRSAAFKWHKRFAEGRDSLDDDAHTGRPRTARTEGKILEVQRVVRDNRSQSIDDIAAATGISHGSCHAILTEDLNMSRVSQHIVPRFLTEEQRQDRVTICGDLIDSADKDTTFLQRIITGDETWCFLYDPQLKRQSATWKSPSSPRRKKCRQDKTKGKVMLEVFFDCSGIVHMEFIPDGVTVNKEKYVHILRRLRQSIRRKRPDFWQNKNWLLLHDNAPAHRSVLVQSELAKQSITVLPHPPYSPDLAPCDFFIFSRMKNQLRGRRFCSAEEVKTAATQALRSIPENAFQDCFQQLYRRWQKCIVAGGDYFEGGCA